MDYNKAIELNPFDFEAYGYCGEAYASIGDYEKAMKNFDLALLINPEDIIAYGNRIWATILGGKVE